MYQIPEFNQCLPKINVFNFKAISNVIGSPRLPEELKRPLLLPERFNKPLKIELNFNSVLSQLGERNLAQSDIKGISHSCLLDSLQISTNALFILIHTLKMRSDM